MGASGDVAAAIGLRIRILMAANTVVRACKPTWKGPWADTQFDRTIVDVARTMNRLNAAGLDVRLFLPADEHARVMRK